MKHITLLFAGAAALVSLPAQADQISDAIKAEMPGLMSIYRDLHANPELSFEEKRSAGILAAAAKKAGFEVTEGVGKTGVVAVMKNGPGPVVLIRADMDGLPVVEQTGLPFASKVKGVSTAGVESGVMHACGHDTHMTTWIAVARYLAANRKDWSGTVVMVGQPAEELGLGARAMLDDGLYSRFPKPDYSIAFHDTHELPSGVIGVTPGYALANVDSVDVTFKGVGGHGSRPHQAKDPIVVASAFVTRVQTLVSRENDPSVPAVVTVGSFHAGAKHNIISDKAELQLTVRSYADEVRQNLLSGIKRVADGEAMVSGLTGDLAPTVVVREPYTRSTFNSPDFSRDMLAFFKSRFGEERARQVPASMGGEDFGEFWRADPDKIKSMIFWVGGTPAERLAKVDMANIPGTHSPFFAPEADKVISTASEALIAATLKMLPRK